MALLLREGFSLINDGKVVSPAGLPRKLVVEVPPDFSNGLSTTSLVDFGPAVRLCWYQWSRPRSMRLH
jgi:hypothetical protein